MSERYLINVVETWRVPDQETADTMEEEFRKDMNYVVASWSKTDKTKKANGEVVEEWVLVKAKKVFNIEKEPESKISVEYK